METLRDLRNQKGLTLMQVATELNVSVRAVSRYEQGTRQINISQVLILARLYDCSEREVIEAQFNSCR